MKRSLTLTLFVLLCSSWAFAEGHWWQGSKNNAQVISAKSEIEGFVNFVCDESLHPTLAQINQHYSDLSDTAKAAVTDTQSMRNRNSPLGYLIEHGINSDNPAIMAFLVEHQLLSPGAAE